MSDMLALMAAQYAKPDPNPYMFQIGQTVRLRKGRSDDGQTSRVWDGAIVKVVDRYCTGMFKDHWYKLMLASGAINEFKEYEIDARYARIRYEEALGTVGAGDGQQATDSQEATP